MKSTWRWRVSETTANKSQDSRSDNCIDNRPQRSIGRVWSQPTSSCFLPEFKKIISPGSLRPFPQHQQRLALLPDSSIYHLNEKMMTKRVIVESVHKFPVCSVIDMASDVSSCKYASSLRHVSVSIFSSIMSHAATERPVGATDMEDRGKYSSATRRTKKNSRTTLNGPWLRAVDVFTTVHPWVEFRFCSNFFWKFIKHPINIKDQVVQTNQNQSEMVLDTLAHSAYDTTAYPTKSIKSESTERTELAQSINTSFQLVTEHSYSPTVWHYDDFIAENVVRIPPTKECHKTVPRGLQLPHWFGTEKNLFKVSSMCCVI